MGLASIVAYDWRQGPEPSLTMRFSPSRKFDLVPHWLEDKPATRLKKTLFVVHGSGDRTAQKFKEYVSRWRKETLAVSSIPEKVNNPSYLKIIALGPKAVPLILGELRDRPTYWFAALEALTEDGPVGPFARFDDQRKAWLTWGVNHYGVNTGLRGRTVPDFSKARERESHPSKSF